MDFRSHRRAGIDSVNRARFCAKAHCADCGKVRPVTANFRSRRFARWADLGLMGIEVPTEYGGAGMDAIAYILGDDRNRRGRLRTFDHHVGQQHAVLQWPAEIRQRSAEAISTSRPIASGAEIGAFALTEPQSGSDATAMRCRAAGNDDGSFVINGKKSWITSGPVAKYILLFCHDPS